VAPLGGDPADAPPPPPPGAAPVLRMRPLLDVFALYGEVPAAQAARAVADHPSSAAPRVYLERLDAPFAAGHAPGLAEREACGALGRALVAALGGAGETGPMEAALAAQPEG